MLIFNILDLSHNFHPQISHTLSIHRTDHHQPADGFRLLPFPDAANPQEEIREMEVDAGRFTRTATGTEPI